MKNWHMILLWQLVTCQDVGPITSRATNVRAQGSFWNFIIRLNRPDLTFVPELSGNHFSTMLPQPFRFSRWI